MQNEIGYFIEAMNDLKALFPKINKSFGLQLMFIISNILITGITTCFTLAVKISTKRDLFEEDGTYLTYIVCIAQIQFGVVQISFFTHMLHEKVR